MGSRPITGRRPALLVLLLAGALAAAALAGVLLAGSEPEPGREPGSEPAAAPCPEGQRCGTETVPGLAERKQAILAAGGDPLDVAVAMLESRDMSTDYPFGDRKTGDSANFGIFKQNWYMLRTACREFEGQPVDRWRDGALLNRDLAADVSCLNQSQDHFQELWFAGHRNGETGVYDPDTADIARYRTAVLWIRDRIAADPDGLRDDTRYWVEVPAI